MEIPTGHL